MFADRSTAGQLLVAALRPWGEPRPLVLGLPRGGVLVAAAVARELPGDLDVLLVKKLRAPDQPELALGALSETSQPSLNAELCRLTGATEQYLANEIRMRSAEIRRQQEQYRPRRPRRPRAGRTVILVDDGLATGATMMAAVQATLLEQPRRLVAAVPVGAPETVANLRAMPGIAAVVCLLLPDRFRSVGEFYEDFRQVSDAEVLAELTR